MMLQQIENAEFRAVDALARRNLTAGARDEIERCLWNLRIAKGQYMAGFPDVIRKSAAARPAEPRRIEIMAPPDRKASQGERLTKAAEVEADALAVIKASLRHPAAVGDQQFQTWMRGGRNG